MDGVEEATADEAVAMVEVAVAAMADETDEAVAATETAIGLISLSQTFQFFVFPSRITFAETSLKRA